ncbi:MAG: tRNA pseudouridine(13) synthase TruD [Psychrosphaera sp.]|nr:tRNA pseudouridine(13) synthase TruD [Psychrosphaera sp.]
MNWQDPVESLSYLHGKPAANGDIRTEDADFIVEEVLGFELSGEGEHVCLFIEKQGENTIYVAKHFVKISGARYRVVCYTGLKDRHGITRQWFSVAVPVKTTIDFSPLESDTIRIVKQTRHLKKLRTGCHRLNKFSIVVRNIDDLADVQARIEQIKLQGVPNYFGSQRFGHSGNNLNLAKRMFGGEEIRDRKLRGLVISAARSLLFNLLVSQRVKQQRFSQPIDGDIFRLSGTRSFFTEAMSDTLLARLAEGDIQIAASLPGDGDWLTKHDALAFEQQVLSEYQSWVDGLIELRVKVDCRPIKLEGANLSMQVLNEHSIRLDFDLPTGSFATALLRELVNVVDCSHKSHSSQQGSGE